MDFVSPNSLLIAVPLTPSSGNTMAGYIFPTQQELQNRKIIALETFTDIDVAYDPLNPGTPVVTAAIASHLFVTLYTAMPPTNPAANPTLQQPGLFYDKIPYCLLRRSQNNDTALTPLPSFAKDIFRIRPTELAFNKCKIEAPTSVAMAETHSALVMVHYLDIDDPGTLWMPHPVLIPGVKK